MTAITENQIYSDVSNIVDELGVEIVTMKLLRKRLEAQYGCPLNDYKELLEKAVEKKFTEPKTQLAVQRAADRVSQGVVNPGKGKKKQTSNTGAKQKGKEIVKGPKRPQSAYFFFVAKNREKIMQENPGISVTQISVKAGEAWKTLTDSEKQPYNVMALEDKKRYETETAEFEKNGGVATKSKKRTRNNEETGPQPPKRPQSAFFLYLNSRRESFIKAQAVKPSVTEITKKLSLEWRELSETEKKPYLDREAELRKMYEKELQKFKLDNPSTKKSTAKSGSNKSRTVKKDKFLVESDESESESSSNSSSSSKSSDSSSDSNSGSSSDSSSSQSDSD